MGEDGPCKGLTWSAGASGLLAPVCVDSRDAFGELAGFRSSTWGPNVCGTHVSSSREVHFEGQAYGPPSAFFSDGLIFIAFKISTGKSAKPIMRLPNVPSSADAPPEIGSQGPSSASYSRGRYLVSSAYENEDADMYSYNFKLLESSMPSLAKTVAAKALSLMVVRLTRQTAARLGATKQRIVSISNCL